MCLKSAAFFCKDRDNEIHLLNVIHQVADFDFEVVPRDREAISEGFEKRATDLLSKAREYLQGQGLKNIKAVILTGASPSAEIIDYAEKEKMNLIIIGARGMSEQARFLLGSESPEGGQVCALLRLRRQGELPGLLQYLNSVRGRTTSAPTFILPLPDHCNTLTGKAGRMRRQASVLRNLCLPIRIFSNQRSMDAGRVNSL
ncbi:MAG: universal stress protein [Desulfomicrobium escambiense]|nr:universal stress protein [Desulfomicrobium escambiense]